MKQKDKKVRDKNPNKKQKKTSFFNKKNHTKNNQKHKKATRKKSKYKQQKQQPISPVHNPTDLCYQDDKVIGKKMHKGFCIKVEKYFGQAYMIKNKYLARLKVKQQIKLLDDIIENLQKKYKIFQRVWIWILKDSLFINKQGVIEDDLMSNFRKVMFHVCEAKSISLRVLVLQNTIISLQSLVWMDCPSLKSLIIENSDVVNLKPLNKCNWKELSLLRIKNNKIPCANFERIKMKKGSYLQVIQNLQPYRYHEANPMINEQISVQDIRLLGRSEARATVFMKKQLFCNNRISQLKIIDKFKSRTMIGWDNQMQDESDEQLRNAPTQKVVEWPINHKNFLKDFRQNDNL